MLTYIGAMDVDVDVNLTKKYLDESDKRVGFSLFEHEWSVLSKHHADTTRYCTKFDTVLWVHEHDSRSCQRSFSFFGIP